jgi:hypothetical protein
MLLKAVTNLLNKELASLEPSNPSQNELVYLLFLYLASLDRNFTTTEQGETREVPDPKILVYSIQLQDHDDIKIRKEALRQIDAF